MPALAAVSINRLSTKSLSCAKPIWRKAWPQMQNFKQMMVITESSHEIFVISISFYSHFVGKVAADLALRRLGRRLFQSRGAIMKK